MSKGVNKVILVGNLSADPEVKYAASGSANTSLSIATSESWTDKNSGEKQERTEWHRVKIFGKLAEIAGEYLKKGRQVYIEGKLSTSKYTDKQGVERYSTDIIADVMQMLGSGDRDDSTPRARPSQAARANSAPPTYESSRQGPPKVGTESRDFDDDIPF